MIDNIYEQLRKIKSYQPSIKALFKASPYDSDANIRKSITEEIFVEELLANESDINEHISRLENALDNIFTPNTIIFLSGYAGNGKTTFIKSFIRKKTNHEHIYVDVHEKRTNIDTNIYKAEDETLSIVKKL